MKTSKRILSLLMILLTIVSIIPMGMITASAVFSVSRDDGVWLFPLPSEYYASFIDWAGCPGEGTCPFCGVKHSPWMDSDHTGNPSGHNGLDISAPENVSVYAPANGIVLGAAWRDGRGYVVMIKHDLNNGWAYYSYSQHLNAMSVSVGQVVSAGSIIGKVGGTGGYAPHLHFGILMAPSTYSFDQVLNSVDWGNGTWLKNPGFATGRVIVNPKNGYGYAGVCNAGAAVDYHRGSVTYTFDKNAVRISSSSIPATGISLNTTQFTIGVGESKTITAAISPSNATNKNVTWSSNVPSIATVSNGKITGVSEGACTITAKTANGKTATCLVVVFPNDAGASAFTSYNGHYFELYDYPTSWYDAKNFCESLGGHLVTITSAQENEAVLQLAKKGTKSRYYIGGTDEKTEGTFEWITGEPFTYRNFAGGEPNATAQAASEDYLFMNQSNGRWGDIINYQANPNVTGFICEYDVPKLNANAVTVIDGKVYELYERNYTITAADKFAEEQGGYLLSLTSAEEQTAVGNWVKAHSKVPYIALGATDAETEGVWKWTSGEKWGYTSWMDGEPNNSQGLEDNAVWVIGSGKWNDTAATKTSAFIIEYALDEWLAQGHSLSEIMFEELPDGADPNDYEIITEYRSRDKSTTTSSAASMDGWTKYDSKTTYGEWSKVQSSKTKPIESDALQITGTWTQYHYYHYLNYYSGCYNIDSISYGTNKGRHDIYINYALSAVSLADQGGKQAYGYYSCAEESPSFNIWFYAGSALFYNYQTRSKTETNYFYKWSDWSAWGKTPIAATDDREVETRTVYRLKENIPSPPATVSSIAIQSKPTKTVYTVGEKFDASGLKIKVTMSDGTAKTITSGFTLSNPDMSKAGTKSVTVTYSGKTVSFTITVKDANPPANTGALRLITPASARVGQRVQIPVQLDKSSLGTLTFTVKYDHTKLKYVSCTESTFDMCDVYAGNTGVIRAACIDNDAVSAGRIAVLTFEVIAPSACLTDLTLTVEEAYDGSDKAVSVTGGTWELSVVKTVLGDLNGDGQVTAIDARWALQAASGTRTLNEEQKAAADINGDGKITAIDARWILQAASGTRVL